MKIHTYHSCIYADFAWWQCGTQHLYVELVIAYEEGAIKDLHVCAATIVQSLAVGY